MALPIESLNNLGQWLVEHLWQLSGELAVLAALVAGAIWLLRIKSPRLRHLFWCLVLVKPAAVLLIASPLTLYGFLWPANISAVTHMEPSASVPPPAPAGPWAAGGTEWPQDASSALAAAPNLPALDAYGGVGLFWLGGAAIVAAHMLVGFAYLTWLLAVTKQEGGPLAKALAHARQAMGIRRSVDVRVSRHCQSPALAGVLRPLILFPSDLAQRLTQNQTERVLAHELAHLRRWDNLTLLVQRLLSVPLFFHPALWLCGWAMRREAEAACDDTVLAAYGGAVSYADSLARVAECRIGLGQRVLVSSFTPTESDFARRVRRVLRGPAAPVGAALTVVAVVAFLALAALGLPTASTPSDKQPPDQPPETRMTLATSQPAKEATAMCEDFRQPTLVKNNQGALLDGYQNLRIPGTYPSGRENTVIACITTALRAAGEDVNYVQLMGIGGAAFRLQLMQPAWCPSSACTGPGFNCQTGIDEGFAHRVVSHDIEHGPADDKPRRIAEARAVTLQSIDAGLPVLWGSEECGLAVGYRYGGQRIVLRPVYKVEPGYDLAKDWPWGVGIVEARGVAKDRRTLARESLQRALDLAATPDFGPYASGFNAWNLWIAQLRDPVRFATMDADALRGAQLANGYIYYCLIDARGCAAKYLRSIASGLGPDSQPHLLQAADAYDQLVKALTPQCPTLTAPMPRMLKEGQQWTQEMRNDQAALLEQALQFETQALNHVKKALEAAAPAPPQDPQT